MASRVPDHPVTVFDLSGTTVAARIAGDPAKPALLLLHGFPSSSRSFSTVIPALADVAYVVAPDLPGFGASDPLEMASFFSTPRAGLPGYTLCFTGYDPSVSPEGEYLSCVGAALFWVLIQCSKP